MPRQQNELKKLRSELDDLKAQVASLFKLVAREVKKDDHSIIGFCRRQGISRTHFYNLVRDGKGPRMGWAGHKRIITPDAESEWLAAREQPDAAA